LFTSLSPGIMKQRISKFRICSSDSSLRRHNPEDLDNHERGAVLADASPLLCAEETIEANDATA